MAMVAEKFNAGNAGKNVKCWRNSFMMTILVEKVSCLTMLENKGLMLARKFTACNAGEKVSY